MTGKSPEHLNTFGQPKNSGDMTISVSVPAKPTITTSINSVGVTTKTKKTSFGLLKRRSSQEDGKRVKIPSK